MATDWIEGLRVVDLKEELKKRELPVSGKKAELVARLTAAVASEAEQTKESGEEPAPADAPDPVPEEKETGDPVEAEEPPGSEAAADPQSQGKGPQAAASSAEADTNVANDHEDGDHIPSGVEDAEEQKDVVPPQAEQLPSSDAQKGTTEEPRAEPEQPEAHVEAAAPATEAKEEKISAAGTEPKRQTREDSIFAVKKDSAAASREQDEPSGVALTEERLPSMQAALLAAQPVAATDPAQDAEMEEAVDFEADDVEEPLVAAGATHETKAGSDAAQKKVRDLPVEAADEPSAKRVKQEAADLPRLDSGKRKREPILFKPQERSGSLPKAESVERKVSTDGKTLERRSSVFDRIGGLDSEKRVGGSGAPPTRTKATRALLITGFIRPFTVNAAQNLFKSYGVVEAMWMPMIRDKAYVLFDSEESAEAARQGMHGLDWPHGNRTSLRPKFVPVEEAEKAIKSEGKELPSPQHRQVANGGGQAAEKIAAAALKAGNKVLDRGRASGDLGAKAQSTEKAPAKPTAKAEKSVTLEDLFRKTATSPHLYWLSLTEEQVAAKQKTREQKYRTERSRG